MVLDKFEGTFVNIKPHMILLEDDLDRVARFYAEYCRANHHDGYGFHRFNNVQDFQNFLLGLGDDDKRRFSISLDHDLGDSPFVYCQDIVSINPVMGPMVNDKKENSGTTAVGIIEYIASQRPALLKNIESINIHSLNPVSQDMERNLRNILGDNVRVSRVDYITVCERFDHHESNLVEGTW